MIRVHLVVPVQGSMGRVTVVVVETQGFRIIRAIRITKVVTINREIRGINSSRVIRATQSS